MSVHSTSQKVLSMQTRRRSDTNTYTYEPLCMLHGHCKSDHSQQRSASTHLKRGSTVAAQYGSLRYYS
eukprot:2656-Heterococcus_DN1.PRE.1